MATLAFKFLILLDIRSQFLMNKVKNNNNFNNLYLNLSKNQRLVIEKQILKG
jgi:hypothetical protein